MQLNKYGLCQIMVDRKLGQRCFLSAVVVATVISIGILPVLNMAMADSDKIYKNTDPDYITWGAGGFDINDDETAGQFEVQARLNTSLWIFKPQVGMFVTSKYAAYAYVGLLVDAFIRDSFVVSPSFSIGASHEGEGKQLGGTLQFRSAVEFSFCFDDRSRLGLQIGHLSNAGIYSENPGTEFVVLNFSVPTIVFSR